MIWGGQTEWTITQSGTWTVPKTGRYYIELYGGGGGGALGSTSSDMNPYGASGGSSCQSYDSVTLTKGDAIVATIGVGGAAGKGSGDWRGGNGAVYLKYLGA